MWPGRANIGNIGLSAISFLRPYIIIIIIYIIFIIVRCNSNAVGASWFRPDAFPRAYVSHRRENARVRNIRRAPSPPPVFYRPVDLNKFYTLCVVNRRKKRKKKRKKISHIRDSTCTVWEYCCTRFRLLRLVVGAGYGRGGGGDQTRRPDDF